MRVLLAAVAVVLLVGAPVAQADCCTYEAPSVGDLVADDTGAWLTFDAPELQDDDRTNRGGIVRLSDEAPQTTALSTDAAGAGLPATDGTTVAWAQVATDAKSGPGRTAPLSTLAPVDLGATLPAEGGVQVQGDVVQWLRGGALQRAGGTVATGVTSARLLADGRTAYVAGGRLQLDQQHLGTAREVLDADVRDGVARIVVDDARGNGRRGATVLVTVAADATVARTTVAKATGNPVAALDGGRVVFLASGRGGAADVFARPVAGGPSRNLTRTKAIETHLVAGGGLVAYGRGFQPRTARLLLRSTSGGGPERVVGGAQPRRFSQARIAVQPDGTAHVAYVDRGTRDSAYCGSLVVRRVDPDGAFGSKAKIADCSVGTTT